MIWWILEASPGFSSQWDAVETCLYIVANQAFYNEGMRGIEWENGIHHSGLDLRVMDRKHLIEMLVFSSSD